MENFEFLPKAVRQMEGKVRSLFNESHNGATVNNLINDVIDQMINEAIRKENNLQKKWNGSEKNWEISNSH